MKVPTLVSILSAGTTQRINPLALRDTELFSILGRSYYTTRSQIDIIKCIHQKRIYAPLGSVIGSREEKVYKGNKSFGSYLSQYQWSPQLRHAVHSSRSRNFAQQPWRIQRTTGLTQRCFALLIGREWP